MPDTELLDAWVVDVDALSASADSIVARRAGAELLTRWAQPHRRYHTVQHLSEMLAALERLGAGLSGRDRRLSRVAAWLHDAVYDVHAAPGVMERDSARLARRALTDVGVDPCDIQVVEDLILLTIEHGTGLPGALAEVFTDADLAILAAPADRFDEYCAQVRTEYAHVPDADYAAARGEILAALVDRPDVYRTRFARARWTAAARANVRRELLRLGHEGPGG